MIGIIEPTIPIITPPTKYGALIKPLDAPTVRIIPISSRLEYIVTLIVLAIK